MAKNGTGKSAEQDRLDRQAAQARKKRGRGVSNGKRHVGDEKPIGPPNLAELQRRGDAKKEAQRKAMEFAEIIKKSGSYLVSRNLQGFRMIVDVLQEHFYGTDVRWTQNDDGYVFGVARKS